MNVLHIWNQAATASVLSEYLNQSGINSNVMQDIKHDSLGMTKFYGDMVFSKADFLYHALAASRRFSIIHLHDAYFMIPFIRALYPKKIIIIHYHGSLIRDNHLGKKRAILERMVNKIIVATPDLLNYKYRMKPIYLPDPIDTIHFKPRIIPTNSRGLALMKHTQSDRQLRTILKDNWFTFHLETTTRERRIIPYKDFPSYLSKYEWFVDIPIINGKVIKANSCTGLQAMSLGLNVVSWDYSVKTKLPYRHEPKNVVKELIRIYNAL